MSKQMNLFGKPAQGVPDEKAWKKIEQKRAKQWLEEATREKQRAKQQRADSAAMGTECEDLTCEVPATKRAKQWLEEATREKQRAEQHTADSSAKGTEWEDLTHEEPPTPQQMPVPQTDVEPKLPQATNPRPPCAVYVRIGRAEDRPLCSRCNMPVDPQVPGTRRLQKSPLRFSCPACNVKGVALYQMFGTWPIPEFKGLSQEEQVKFWNSADASREGLRKATQNVLERSMEEIARNATKRRYLPLEVWEKQGFSIEDIKARGKYEWNPELGHTYGCAIHEEEKAKVETLVRKHMEALENQGKALKALKSIGRSSSSTHAAPGSKRRAKEESESGSGGEDSDSEESSQSDCDDSDDTEDSEPFQKTKKRGKSQSAQQMAKHASKLALKAKKKEAKQAEKRRRVEKEQKLKAKVAEKEQKALQKKMHSTATKCMAKLSPLTASLAEILKDKDFDTLPRIAQRRCTEIQDKLQAWESDAQAIIEGKNTTTSDLDFDAVANACKDANIIRTSAAALLKTVSKF
jgi:hypothetical protein